LRITQQVIDAAPEMSSVLVPYLNAHTLAERRDAALYAVLKFPHLSPYFNTNVESFQPIEDSEYYLETSWWCPLAKTEYNDSGQEVPKVVESPPFLTRDQIETARRERTLLIGLGDAKSYLGKRVVQWAKRAPNDERIPEALFIAVKANEEYKYGCNGWDYDEKTQHEAEKILTTKYPQSPWTAKLKESEK